LSSSLKVSGLRARVLAVSNQKGGEGKTTTAVNLAASLAAAEHRVLLVDLDPQANASASLGYLRLEVERGTYDFLAGEDPTDLVQPTQLPGLRLLPSSQSLAGVEVELVGEDEPHMVLARALERIRDRGEFELIILDCPPSLGLLTVNALAAADAVLIPMQAKYFSLEGLTALQETIDRVKRSVNPGLEIDGILFCMFDPRTNLARQVVREVKKHFSDLVYDTVIPVNIRLSESPSYGEPALLHDIQSKGAQAYLELAREFLSRMEARPTT